MKTLLGSILAFALLSELLAIFCYGGWIRWALVAALLLTCGLLNLVVQQRSFFNHSQTSRERLWW